MDRRTVVLVTSFLCSHAWGIVDLGHLDKHCQDDDVTLELASTRNDPNFSSIAHAHSIMQTSYRLMLLFLLALPHVASGVEKAISSPDAAAGKTSDAAAIAAKSAEKKVKLEVVQLNSRNFGKNLTDGNVWLIEFYSPNCVHCVEFAPIYEGIARHYHGSIAHKIKVGKVNGEVERALVSRFAIYGYPSFYVVDGWKAYHFQQSRRKEFLMSYAEGGYKKSGSMSFYSSPMGPLGQMQGMVMSTGHTLFDLFLWFQRTFGLSSIVVGMILFGSIFLGCFFLIVSLALVIPPRQKQD